ncbi:hypothetical protein J2799_004350 [Chryseobacterium vietnamense]|uniref:hypothetical protein n=1 Tax=Chryseobacterium vietnamense TaxID=866785 RepID=UPI002863914B|nr:hypothetical protein [Chryseobacterium vietnamense]MDR6489800.1 hypothetical protein [Chryseobacterium vietnamense]
MNLSIPDKYYIITNIIGLVPKCTNIRKPKMGFEAKIKAKFTDQQNSEILDLLESSSPFEKKPKYTHLSWDFRHPENTGKLPNKSIIFDERWYLSLSIWFFLCVNRF